MKDTTVLEFIEATGSSAPAPGGGSIAALTASSAAALIEMVANLTLGKGKYASVQEEMQSIQEKTALLKRDFLTYIEKDTEAFQGIMAAYQLPKETEDEVATRLSEIQRATRRGAQVPFEIGELAASLLPLAEAVIVRGNTNAVTDGLIAVVNARAAVRAAFYNVKINLGTIRDAGFVETLSKQMEALEHYMEVEEQRILNLVQL